MLLQVFQARTSFAPSFAKKFPAPTRQIHNSHLRRQPNNGVTLGLVGHYHGKMTEASGESVTPKRVSSNIEGVYQRRTSQREAVSRKRTSTNIERRNTEMRIFGMKLTLAMVHRGSGSLWTR